MRKTNRLKPSVILLATLAMAGLVLLVIAGRSGAAINELGWNQGDYEISARQVGDEIRLSVKGPGGGSLTYFGPLASNRCDRDYVRRWASSWKEVDAGSIGLTENSGGKYYCIALNSANQIVDHEPVLVKNALRDIPFNRGRIIDDGVLTDYGSMSVDDIEHFLRATVGDGGRFGYGYCDRGSTPTHTCLFEYAYNPRTGSDNYGRFDAAGRPEAVAGGLSAAEIIHEAAHDFEINPQVLLTVLQKEQTLVTDASPKRRQFEIAAGFACPDGRGCSASAEGFYYQVRGAAWALRKYLYYQDNGFRRFGYGVGTHRIPTYPPGRPDCPAVKVDIENKATAALYIYTPYVYAPKSVRDETGDRCVSNGNKNFWGFFNLYFGPAAGEDLPAQNRPESGIGIRPLKYDENEGGYPFELRGLQKGSTVLASRALSGFECHLLRNPYSGPGILAGGSDFREDMLVTPEDDGRRYCLVLMKDGKVAETRTVGIEYGLLGNRLKEAEPEVPAFY